MIQFTSIVQQGNYSWQFGWTDDGSGSWRVVLYGIQQAIVTSPSYIHAQIGWDVYPPPIEVVPNDGSLALSEQFPPYILMQWYATAPTAAGFIVSEYIGGQWVQSQRVAKNTAWVYSIQTPALPDNTEHTYRVVTIDSLNQSSPGILEWSVSVVTPPVLVETSVEALWDESDSSIVIQEVA